MRPAEAVFADRLIDLGEAPQAGRSLLLRAARLQPPTGAGEREATDPTTAELAREVCEGATIDEVWAAMFPKR